MLYKQILSIIAIGLTFVAFYPYIRGILNNTIKPHVFSWVIWGISTLMVFIAQLQDHAGVGAWPIGISGLITSMIAVLAYLKRADISITRLDWVFFISALLAIPVWLVTADPLWAVLILTTVDLCGFGPTLRKAYTQPYSESLIFFALFMLRNLIVILALEHYSWTTMLFPAAIAASCLLLIALIIIRRKQINKRV